MKRRLSWLMLLLFLLPAAAAGGPLSDIASALPPGAKVTVTKEADLTEDGRPEIIVGYTVPGQAGRAAVLERTPAGGFRRHDLTGAWAPHYQPRFAVRDLTGDGRPELIREVPVAGAWEEIAIYRWAAGTSYEPVLRHTAHSHLLWDADGDGRTEIVGNSKIFSPGEQQFESFRWDGTQYVAWHTAYWGYRQVAVPKGAAAPLPAVSGMTPLQAEAAINAAGYGLGMIVPIDSAAPPDQVTAQTPPPGAAPSGEGPQVHIALGAGNTRFAPGHLPPVYEVIYHPGSGESGMASTGANPARVGPWVTWLESRLKHVQQVVHAGGFLPGPAYLFHIPRPWTVSLGGRWETVHWVGVGMAAPYRGLIYLAVEDPPADRPLPRFTAALYTGSPVPPPPIPPARPLARYLQAQPELEAFVTFSPESWRQSLRLRGIEPTGWPERNPRPAIEGAAPPNPRLVPIPEEALVTVMNGYVRRARQVDGHIWADVASAPGRVHLWPVSLAGYSPEAPNVYIHLKLPDGGTQTATRLLQSWRARP